MGIVKKPLHAHTWVLATPRAFMVLPDIAPNHGQHTGTPPCTGLPTSNTAALDTQSTGLMNRVLPREVQIATIHDVKRPGSQGQDIEHSDITIVINTTTVLMFMRGRDGDLNIRGAYMHVWAIGTSDIALTAHLVMGDAAQDNAVCYRRSLRFATSRCNSNHRPKRAMCFASQ